MEQLIQEYHIILISVLLGGSEAVGNLLLGISKAFIQVTALIISGDVIRMGGGLAKTIQESQVYSELMKLILWLMPILVAVALIRIFNIAKNTFLKGTGALNEIIHNLAGFILAVGIILLLSVNPGVFNNVVGKLTLAIDDLFTYGFNQYIDDDIISPAQKEVHQSILFRKAIFDPWVAGMFQDKYENLYTQYSNERDENKLKQSNDSIENIPEGERRKSSANMTGDIWVPKYNMENESQKIRNWAAFAWSTQSKFHISSDETLMDKNAYSWPKSIRTERNDNIYIDSFKWIDAKLNISPTYISSGKVNSYDRIKAI